MVLKPPSARMNFILPEIGCILLNCVETVHNNFAETLLN